MKKAVLIVLCLFGLISTGSARLVEIHRSRGFLGCYSKIDQVYMGHINGQEWWVLNCENPGLVSCKLRPSAGKSTRETEIEEIENTKLSELMINIEQERINNGEESGQASKHYQATLSDNSVVDIYIQISWEPDTDKTTFHANITNS